MFGFNHKNCKFEKEIFHSSPLDNVRFVLYTTECCKIRNADVAFFLGDHYFWIPNLIPNLETYSIKVIECLQAFLYRLSYMLLWEQTVYMDNLSKIKQQEKIGHNVSEENHNILQSSDRSMLLSS